nr:CAZy families GH5 protein [uncultured Ruminococcus sp.]
MRLPVPNGLNTLSVRDVKGITCVWWDNGAFNGSGENFGLLNRSTLEWEYPSIIEGIMNSAQTQPEVDLGY